METTDTKPVEGKPPVSADVIEETGKRKRRTLEDKVSYLESENETLKSSLDSIVADVDKLLKPLKTKPAEDPEKAAKGKSFFDELTEFFNKPLFILFFLLSTISCVNATSIAWDPVDNAKYELLVSYRLVATLATNSTIVPMSKIATNLVFIQVRAYNNSGTSAWSNQLVVPMATLLK